jgi:GNAT superfamily N-acetyltransferase
MRQSVPTVKAYTHILFVPLLAFIPPCKAILHPHTFLIMISFISATEKDAQTIANIARISVKEAHLGSCPEEILDEYIGNNYNNNAIKKELANYNNIYSIINYNNLPAGFYKIVFNAAHAAINRSNTTKLDRIYLLQEFQGLKLGYKLLQFNIAAYYAQKISPSNKLDITAAIRADYFNNRYNDKLATQILTANATILSPKLTINYKINDKVQLYLYNGRGFHSNDTRVAVQQNGRKVVPPAYGTDFGGIFKIGKNLVLQSALWYLWLDQEFVYVGDEGVVEAGGKTRRIGFDFSARYEVAKNLFADMDISITNPRAIGVAKAESYLPLAPRITSIGGLTYRKEKGLNGSLRYRFMDNRPANENNSVLAKGYFVADAAINYTDRKWEAGLSIQNLLNTKWKETQFDTESQLRNETAPVSEIHFTPGTPFFARLSFSLFF